MRAWLEAFEDKSLPSLVADAEGEVAAAFKGIYESLPGARAVAEKRRSICHYQSTCQNARSARALACQGCRGKGLERRDLGAVFSAGLVE